MKFAAALLFLFALPVEAGWQFSQPIEVGGLKGKTIFHHLESANRKGLAESGGQVALVWEDNRDGIPHCRLAVRKKGAKAFSALQLVSNGECYEPVVEGMGGGRFALAWEEDGNTWVRLTGKSAPLKVGQDEAAQITLARADDHTLYAAWVEKAGQHKRVMIARLRVEAGTLKLEYRLPIEDRLPEDEQAYPALAVNADGSIAAAWEDRRHKHTAMLAAHSQDGGQFSAPSRLIDVPLSRSITLGAGMGSMRPTLASCGPSCDVALWLDKRDFLSGYDVYAAMSQDGGRSFGRNFKVQDSFGENVAQWHAAIASNRAGRIVAVWDDDRDGSPDVWLSNWNGETFSDNIAVPGASGSGVQVEPIAHIDTAGTLHLAWLERSESGGTKLKYASAVWKE